MPLLVHSPLSLTLTVTLDHSTHKLTFSLLTLLCSSHLFLFSSLPSASPSSSSSPSSSIKPTARCVRLFFHSSPFNSSTVSLTLPFQVCQITPTVIASALVKHPITKLYARDGSHIVITSPKKAAPEK